MESPASKPHNLTNSAPASTDTRGNQMTSEQARKVALNPCNFHNDTCQTALDQLEQSPKRYRRAINHLRKWLKQVTSAEGEIR